jgi:large subunit ribosomal protein L29
MAKQSFRDLDDVDLVTQLKETKDELFKLRFQHATGQLTNYSRLGEARRDIARLETELRAREIAAAEEDEAETPTAVPAGADTEETS